ncbi:MAG TPA: hypothetical protein VET48_11415 [Steroidobacteraceae bacterium]|nr:hypothetical protein [Steroidobacteraceae bacterium]
MPTPGLQLSALDIINSALRLIGVLATGEIPSNDEAQDALITLNQMLDSWDTERLTIFTIQRNLFNLVPGKASYTLGTGGDFNIPRPERIQPITILNLSNPLQPLELPIAILNELQFAAIPVKNIQSALPQNVYPDYGFPLNTLTYWPVPSVVVQTGLYSWALLQKFPDLVAQFSFPPGYFKAIRYNLALELAPEFGVQQIDPLVVGNAALAKGNIKSANSPNVVASVDRALVSPKGGNYNWITDMPAGRQV